MADEHRRREFLQLTGGAAAFGLAGCTGRGGEPTATDEPTATGEPKTTTTTEESTTTTTTESTESTTEPPSMSTVFHFSSETDTHSHAIANVANLLADESTDVDNVVLVANGVGIKLLAEETSESPDRVRSLIEDGVSFRACRNSMEAFSLSEDDLIEGVETVPAGVGELTKLQAREGYAYIETP